MEMVYLRGSNLILNILSTPSSDKIIFYKNKFQFW